MNSPVIELLIIGGGASAVALAAALAESGHLMPLVIAERAPKVGRGIAYSTEREAHILNVPSQLMGISAAAPDGFLRWCESRSLSIQGADFVSRQLYGEYLDQILDQSLRQHQGRLWNTAVVGLKAEGDHFIAFGEDGQQLRVRRVVLALGHTALTLPVRDIRGAVDQRIVENPWALLGYQNLSRHSTIGIIGSGLTAMDVVGAFEQDGYQGSYVLISRRGLLPFASQAVLPAGSFTIDTAVLTLPLRQLVRWLREQVRALEDAGQDWRPVVDAFRSHIPGLWRRLTETERARFLRHLRPYWEVVRHRMPSDARARVDQLSASGRLRIIRGRIAEIDLNSDPLKVELQILSVAQSSQLSVDRLFNCTGGSALRSDRLTGLLASLHSQELIAIDRFGLGLMTTPEGLVLNRAGAAVPGLFALGPLRRASEWESTAMREVRQQAADIAKILTGR